ncbi:MAG: oxygenase MpaB family protein [Micromonosporaceae bacterium]
MTNTRMLAGHGWPFDATRPREDHGFFGPDSPTWRVWTNVTALVGFQRAVVLEHFDPFLTAAVADAQGIYSDPLGRLDGTLGYFTIVAIGDGRAAIEASELLKKVHARATGIEPITGKRYSANNPESQLWIHLTGWHSVLKCYELYGPGRLTPEQERRYWADCAIAAELQTCQPSDVPRSREGVRDYFEAVRPRLCSSERAHRAMHYLLRPPRAKVGLQTWLGGKLLARATIASLPAWMRELGGFDQYRVVDLGARVSGRVVAAALTPMRLRLMAAGRVAPSVQSMWRWALTGAPPQRDAIVTPAEARERHAGGSAEVPAAAS